MLFTFKSATNANLIMHEKSGKEILALLNKNTDETRGVITIEELPAAIVILQSAMAADKARQQETAANSSNSEAGDEPPVSLPQRAAPFIEMLERAVIAGKPVLWGV